jgi:hypothetical protein
MSPLLRDFDAGDHAGMAVKIMLLTASIGGLKSVSIPSIKGFSSKLRKFKRV